MKQTASKLLVMLTTFVSLTSCNVEKYCQERFPAKTSDSTTTVIEYVPVHDTLYLGYNELLFDTVTEIPPNVLIHHEEKKGRLNASFDIKKGRITFKCSEDSLAHIIDGLRKEITITQKSSSVETEKEFVEHWYLTPLIWWFFITIAFITGMIVKKFYGG